MALTVAFGRVLTSHRRGRWFDPSITHFRRAAAARLPQREEPRSIAGSFVQQPCRHLLRG